MDKITFCIPSKSNLRYLKTCIPSIREKASRPDHDIIIFVDSDEDGTVEWLEANAKKLNVKYFTNPDIGSSLFGIGKAYDYCIEQAETDVVMIFHADMMLGKDADLHSRKHLERGKVVCATRIEPPIHPNAGEKILRDFGMWPEEFKSVPFDNYVDQLIKDNENVSTAGIFAPWMVYKEDLLGIGGHDPRMKSCREDSDLFNRFKLNGYELVQSWDSLVYHLTGRGAGSFDGDPERHKAWQKEMQNSTKEFIRKWGSNVLHTAMMDPIVPPKYDIEFRITKGTPQLLEILEPWCSVIRIDLPNKEVDWYVKATQSSTVVKLIDKINPSESNPDIVVEISGDTFTQDDLNSIQQLSQIIQESGSVGRFQLGNLNLSIQGMKEYQKDLITI